MRAHNKDNVVMVVDDDLLVRKIIRGSLSGVASVVDCGDGAEVVKLYKQHMPDVIFLDIHLPNRMGVDILKDIREFDPKAYVVMLSADSSIDNVVKAKEYGIKGFLTKPFARDRVIEHLHKCDTVVFLD